MLPEPLAGLRGLRLALYDEALAAGPLGIGRGELLALVAEEAQRMGLQPAAQLRDLEWLAGVRLLVEIRPAFYRARRKDDVTAEYGAKKPEAPAVVAQLRTPVYEPSRARGGQSTFF